MSLENSLQVERRLSEILSFLQPHLSLANSHMVNFITDNLWEKHVPSEIACMTPESAYEVVWNWGKNGADFQDASPLGKFLQEAWSMSLQSEESTKLLFSVDGLLQHLIELGCERNWELDYVKNFMSPKKFHEVEALAGVIAVLAQVGNVSCVVDIGGGKGYLGSSLALNHNLRVLNIDSSDVNTSGAVHLNKKMEVLWNRQKHTSKQEGRNKNLKMKKNVNDFGKNTVNFSEEGNAMKLEKLCKQVTAFITSDSDLAGMVVKNFPPCEECNQRSHCGKCLASYEREKQELCLVGLHTCGNLASSCFRIFCSNVNVKSLCNIGCCYNLLSEEFCTDITPDTSTHPPTEERCTEFGFPMSSFLRKGRFVLGRNARMLACQSIDRIAEGRKVVPASLFYRALLQVLLLEHVGDGQAISVGRLGSQVNSLHEYIHKALQRLSLDLEISDVEINHLKTSYGSMEPRLHVFFLMRLALAPVIETVILLDRLLYLYEQGIEHAFLTQVFNPVLSPRCYGILAFKTCDN